MLRKEFNRKNQFFTTYYIYDTDKQKYIGIIEDHDRGVKHRYFIGWKFQNNEFVPNTQQQGKTKTFYNYDDALTYIQGDFENEN